MLTEAPDFTGEMKSCVRCGKKSDQCEAEAYIEGGQTTFRAVCPNCWNGAF